MCYCVEPGYALIRNCKKGLNALKTLRGDGHLSHSNIWVRSNCAQVCVCVCVLKRELACSLGPNVNYL